MNAGELAPTGANQRLQNLDVLRGFALLGIFLMNVEYFGRPLADMGQGIQPGQAPFDHALSWLIYVFVQGKFWILFSLLFGMGFALMDERARAAGRDFTAIHLRRSLALLAIGLAHAWLVWAGDILVAYAIGALLLTWFRDLPPERQGRWGALLYGLPTLGVLAMVALMLLLGFAGGAAGEHADPAHNSTQAAARAVEVLAYSQGSWWQATQARVQYFFAQLIETLAFEPFALGMFLVGAWLLRSGAIADPQAHAPLYRRLRRVVLPVGVALALASAAVSVYFDWDHDGPRSLLAMSLMLAASPLMSLGYLALVVGALHTPRGARVLGVLAPAGRMALSNYLLQSFIGTWVFYGHGLGLWGQVSRRWQVAGVLVVFALQVVASRWWLARFRFGPAEWLWRACTYGRFPPMRVAAVHNL
ncbi:DUF418 domain-containing protein [Lysobacter sp. LF1]|uniref:DUF418 domain-containing protein n=1 Tax=Lysobacter stagni TaxID=3045172 RepID=A0ABT6XGE5_9GAMM|nr:DUF418 domain-containing protein [Lysobacter sp. LF1]MDI9239218.1 DUF418 domain-containing protein [Lysobacter sp. LF1]